MAPRKKPALQTNQRAATDVDTDVGRRLRLARLGMEMSQDQVATALKVSFQQIQKYEKGVNRLSVARLIQLAELFSTTPHELIGWKSAFKVQTTIDAVTVGLVEEFKTLDQDIKSPMKNLILSIIAASKRKK
jgi:transcriptional regulator with XRE-family HTH domain